MTSLSFLHNTSYVEVEPLNVRPDANVTITFATEQENGVVLPAAQRHGQGMAKVQVQDQAFQTIWS